MKSLIKWLNNSAVLSILLVAGFTVDLVLIGRAWGLDRGEWASWVQAIGSILAIAGAFAISTLQSKKEFEKDRVLARAEVQRRLRGVAGITLAAKYCSEGVCLAFEKEPFDRTRLESLFEKSTFDDTIDALKAVPLHELGTQDAVLAIIWIKDSLARLQHIVEDSLQAAATIPGPPGGSNAQSFLDEQEERSKWAMAYARQIQVGIDVFARHPDLRTAS